MLRPVVAYPNKRLRTPALSVIQFNDDLAALCRDMADTMEAATGAGLSANQVGALARVFVISKEIAKTPDHMFFVNPTVEPIGTEGQTNKEGCLSLPGVFVDVTRFYRVRVKYQDVTGEPHELEADGYFAQALQHEAEHLEGNFYLDRVGPVRRELIRKKNKHLAGKWLDYRNGQKDLQEGTEASS